MTIETKIELTQAQRRMVVEYFAEECATDLPADSAIWSPTLAKWATKLEEALDIGRLERWQWNVWQLLVFRMRKAQSLDRDPSAFMYLMGYPDDEDTVDSFKRKMDQAISEGIDAVAR